MPANAWLLIDPLMDILQKAYGEYDAELKGFYATVAKAYPWAVESGLFTLPKVGSQRVVCACNILYESRLLIPRAAHHAANVL